METLRALVSVQLLVTAFLAVLLWSLHVRFHRAEFNRWWAAAWTSSALFLGVGWWALSFPPGVTLLSGAVVLIATLLGFIVAPLLVFGAMSLRSPASMTPRRARLGIGAALLLGTIVFAVSLIWANQPLASLSVRQGARTVVLAAALLFCAQVFFQRFRSTRSVAALVTSISCLGYAITQSVYAGATSMYVIDTTTGDAAGVGSVVALASVNLLHIDVLLICGLCLGMILLLMEAHQQSEVALLESANRRHEVVEENRQLQLEIQRREDVERALRGSDEKFAIAFRSSPCAMAIISRADGRFLDVNAAFESLCGYDRDELVNRPAVEAGIWTDVSDRELLGDLLSGERRLTAREMGVRHVSGREATVVFSAEVVPVGGEHCVLLAGLDTTARKEAEARHDAVLKALPDWVFLIDAAGNYVGFHGSTRGLLAPPEQFIGRNTRDVLPPELADRAMANVNDALKSDYPVAMEYSLRVDDEDRYYEVRSVRSDRDHVLSLVREVTDRKRAEQKARELRDELTHAGRVLALGELNGSLAHEVNQPLAAITTNAYVALRLLEDGSPPVADLRELITDIAADSRRIDDVLKRMRVLLKKDPRDYAVVDINVIVSEVLKLLNSSMIERGITTEVSLSPRPTEVLGDRIQLQQVVLNLLMNAADAVTTVGVDDRRVSVTTTTVNGEVIVSVADRGESIPESDFARMFEPFFTTKRDGMGLGLSICRAIMEAHDGEISARRNDGRGLTCWFSLEAVERESPLVGVDAGAETHAT